MSRMTNLTLLVVACFPGASRLDLRASEREPFAVIVRSRPRSFAEALAPREIRRYVYLSTGNLLPIVDEADTLSGPPSIVVGSKTSPVVTRFLRRTDARTGALRAARDLAPQAYRIQTLRRDGVRDVLIVGGDAIGTLYASYRFAEILGVRFYLHGDVVPDRTAEPEIPDILESAQPLFEHRGIQPFHDFPEGPDWWSEDGYKAILAQLPKLRMNFFGLHTYPEGGVGPEPTVWIGLPDDAGRDGEVRHGYPSRHFSTLNGTWGYRAMKTGDYVFGADAMFDRDAYAVDYMEGMAPWPPGSEAQSELFSRVGALLRRAFTFARRLGIQTCVGTETPLKIPTPVRKRIEAAGRDPTSPDVVRAVYEGMFLRIQRTHPLDYYWFWTPEGWTWQGASEAQVGGTLQDLRLAIEAAQKVRAPFTLATCGWVLGPPGDRALFDTHLPKAMPMSCINRQVGHDPVEPGFAAVKDRPKWAIPWLEDDPAMISPQLWVGRMRRDAYDALRYGCTGLMGIHWRTRILAPNVASLARAAWDQEGWKPREPEESSGAARPPEGARGGKFAEFRDHDIAGTADDVLFRTVRYDVDAYHLDVPDGTYTVTLRFCEPHYREAGRRVFGVRLQGKQVIEELDIFSAAGADCALDYVFPEVGVEDGRLVLEFVRRVEFPSIAALSVVGPRATRKINCGGPAWGDYVADWPPGRGSGPERHLEAGDFYADWALSEFGPEVAEPVAKILTRIDGRLPRPSDWAGGPGGLKPDKRPWKTVATEYQFVDALMALRDRVRGAENLERFGYWLSSFRYMWANAKVNCLWARYNEAMEKVRAEETPEARRKLAKETALPARETLVRAVAEAHRHLLRSVTTTGGMGNVTNWQQHILPGLLLEPGRELAEILGEDLPPEAVPSKKYDGEPHMFVPTVRSLLVKGEPLRLRVIVLGARPREAVLSWRSLGDEDFATRRLEHVARGVWEASIPADVLGRDFEYHVGATTESGKTLLFPAAAPRRNQTVVVLPRDFGQAR